ncbi:13423_t:CDS:2, partial [Dentiscutata heterogama]
SIQSYIHRIGRTGRAVNVMKDSGCEVPNWMLELKNPSKESKQQLRKKPIKRKTIDTRSDYDKKKIKPSIKRKNKKNKTSTNNQESH